MVSPILGDQFTGVEGAFILAYGWPSEQTVRQSIEGGFDSNKTLLSTGG